MTEQRTYHASVDDREARRFDTTDLDVLSADGVHRDYAAHYFRWSWADRKARERMMSRDRDADDPCRILDVGCGSRVPLSRVLTEARFPVRVAYVGVDVGLVKDVPKRKNVEVLQHFNFVERWPELVAREPRGYELVTCFEAIEHMSREDGCTLMWGLAQCAAVGGEIVLSTPVFDGHRARNHIHEWAPQDLLSVATWAGLCCTLTWGTFVSYPTLRKTLRDRQELSLLDVIERLRAFYSDETVSNFVAPLYPEIARNLVYVFEKAQ